MGWEWGCSLQDSECLGDKYVLHKDSDLLIYSGEQTQESVESPWGPWDGNRCFVGLCLCVSWNSLPLPQPWTLSDSQAQNVLHTVISSMSCSSGRTRVCELKGSVCVSGEVGHSHASNQDSY